MKKHVLACALGVMSLTLGAQKSNAFTLFLKAGDFYGPGNQGTHAFQNGEVRNLTFTGPFQGVIPFFNNGPAPPNVIAEVLQGGVIDGLTSGGTPINENIDTALQLNLDDPDTHEKANIMVVAVKAESVTPDALGNLVFHPQVIADPGIPALEVPFTVTFTTGAVQIQKSLKTQMGAPGGHDRAGPYLSGQFIIGKVGDFDQDGMLDGNLVLSGNAPMELIAGRGDPIGQLRPWVSDIPVTPSDAYIFTVRGIVANFPKPLATEMDSGFTDLTLIQLSDVGSRIDAALGNIDRYIRSPGITVWQHQKARLARALTAEASEAFHAAQSELTDGRPRHQVHQLTRGFELLGSALAIMTGQPAPPPHGGWD